MALHMVPSAHGNYSCVSAGSISFTASSGVTSGIYYLSNTVQLQQLSFYGITNLQLTTNVNYPDILVQNFLLDGPVLSGIGNW